MPPNSMSSEAVRRPFKQAEVMEIVELSENEIPTDIPVISNANSEFIWAFLFQTFPDMASFWGVQIFDSDFCGIILLNFEMNWTLVFHQMITVYS